MNPMKFIDEGMKDQFPELLAPIGEVRQQLQHDERYTRTEDMSPDGRLVLIMQEDGDVCLGVIESVSANSPGAGFYSGVEFCSVGSGGGKSPRVREALVRLMLAIKLDNEDRK